MKEQSRWPWIAFTAVCIFWGTTAPAIRLAVRYFPPLQLSGVRFALAGALLLVVLMALGQGPTHWGVALQRSIPGGLSLALANALTCIGFQTVPSAHGALILATTALLMTLIDSLWLTNRRRAAPLTWPGLLLGLAGVALLFDVPHAWQGPMQGSLILLLSSLCWAFGSVWQSRHPSHLPPILEAALQMLIASVVLLPVSRIIGERWNPDVPVSGWLAFVFLVLTGSLIGFVAFVFILRTLPPKIVALYTYINPIVATGAGWWWLGERVGGRFWLACATILGSVALVRYAELRASIRVRPGSAVDSTIPPLEPLT